MSRIVYLLKIAAEADDKVPFDLGDYLSDIIDILNYICKDEQHTLRVAQDHQIYKLIHQGIKKVKGSKHMLLHSAMAMAASLLNDKTKRNMEVANERWGCDEEGFKLLEKLRDKTSKETPTLISTYSKEEIKSSGIKLKLLRDMNVASLISEYFVHVHADSMSMKTHESILTFLLDLAEDKPSRPYMVNKSLFEYLSENFSCKDTSPKLKKQIGEVNTSLTQLISMIGGVINPQSLSYSLRYFIVDILCHNVESSTKEIYIFESTVG